MDESSCPGCRQRDEIIARLQQQLATLTDRVRLLEEQLAKNASNSSLPPSANPPQAPKPVVKQPSGKKPGGQPGHPPALQRRLPPERLQQIIPFVPASCRRCGHDLPQQADPDDPEPSWHQVAELPQLAAHVTEYQGHARICPACQTVSHAAIPADLCRHSFGPRLAATLAYLVGCHRVSRRGVEEIAQAVFEVPLSLGSICHLEQQMSQALAPAHAERVEYLFRRCLTRAPNAEETAQLVKFFRAQKRRCECKELDAAKIAGTDSSDVNERAAWTALARILFNLDEAICSH